MKVPKRNNSSETFYIKKNPQCIVIDLGSSYIRAGFSDKDEPSVTIPSVVGYSKYHFVNSCECESTKVQTGDEALKNMGALNLIYPIGELNCQMVHVKHLIDKVFMMLCLNNCTF
jgi:hypothetical protein